LNLPFRACALVALSAWCTAGLALEPPARDADDEPRSSETDGPASPPTFGEELVVTGRRLPSADATAAASVVDARRFAGEQKTVAELVATAPGVAVNGYGGLGQLTTVSIRGSSPDEVKVLLDGLPLNTAAGGGVDLSRIPRAWIDRIQIVRGAAGTSYGPGAMAGAVDVVTRHGAAGSWSAETAGGSLGTFSAGADGALGGEDWGLLLAGAYDRTGGRFAYELERAPSVPGSDSVTLQRDHDGSWSGGALAKLWAAIGRASFDAVAQLSGGRRDLPGTAYHFTPDDGQDDARVGLVTRLRAPIGDDLELELGATYRQDRLDVRIAPFPEYRQQDHAAEASARLLWRAGPSALAVRASGSFERLTLHGAGAHAWGGGAVTLTDELALVQGRLRLTAAARYDRQGPFDGASARLGARWAFTEVLSVRAGSGRAFRIPSFGELYLQQGLLLPNPALVPESSWSADAALVAEGRLGLASAGAFVQLYEDLIVYEAIWQGRMKPFNEDRAAARGIELELASAPLGPAALSASLAYTWLSTETLRGTELTLGKELPHRAPHRLFARLAAAPGRVEVHGEAHYVAAQWGDTESSAALRIPAALTLNAGASVLLTRAPDLHLGLEVRNLLDDRSLQDGFGYPLPGRMALLTLRVAGGKETRTP
jgi:iron complex outermembrane receptor protein